MLKWPHAIRVLTPQWCSAAEQVGHQSSGAKHALYINVPGPAARLRLNSVRRSDQYLCEWTTLSWSRKTRNGAQVCHLTWKLMEMNQEQRQREVWGRPGWLLEMSGMLCCCGTRLIYLQVVKWALSWPAVGPLFIVLQSSSGSHFIMTTQFGVFCHKKKSSLHAQARTCAAESCDISHSCAGHDFCSVASAQRGCSSRGARRVCSICSNVILSSGVCTAPPTGDNKLKLLVAAAGWSSFPPRGVSRNSTALRLFPPCHWKSRSVLFSLLTSLFWTSRSLRFNFVFKPFPLSAAAVVWHCRGLL